MKSQVISNKTHILGKMMLAFATCYLIFGTSLPASAQQADAIGITVSPITDEFTLKPGQVTSRIIRVINPNDSVITLYPVILNFTTDNENGQPIFFAGTDDSKSYTLSNWISFDREFIRIAKAEEELVKITIAAPADAEPGGHYGAVLFSTKKPDFSNKNDAEIGVVGLVGTLYLATVPGKITEKLELEQFSLPRISLTPPVNSQLVFKNNGNVHLKPKGEITVKNWSGNQVGVIEVNEGNGNVLPESRRRFGGSWKYRPLTTFGLYTFTLQATYGSEQVEITAIKRVLIIPVWILILVIAGLALIGYKLWKKLRNRPLQSKLDSSPKRIIQ